MSTNWHRLEDLFAQAIELAPADRRAFLDRHCAGAPELREEIESLLQANDQAESSFRSRSSAVRDILGALGSSLLTNHRLGPYQMGPIIGEGGMGIVYQAVDARSSVPVAVKVLPQELSLDSPWRKRFSREVRATAAIHHANVVRILDYGEESGCLFLVMELIPGESLRAILSRGALPLQTALDYAIRIAAALEAAHTAGVIHHDLKPGNIMVTPAEDLKVVDFGLSRFEDDSDSSRSRLSQVGTPAGTIDYLSPEQAGGRHVDARSDVFAFGSVLYEMLAGRRAFHRTTNLETAAAILRDHPAPLPDSVPAPVAGLVAKCLAKDVRGRVQSARELGAALASLRDKLLAGKLKPRRFRRARRLAAWMLPAAALTAAAFGLARLRTLPTRPLRFQQLTNDPHVTMEPALSYDGSWLAYASDRAEDGNVDIWIQPTGQGRPRRLTTNPAVDHQPSLSPDGAMVAFRSEREPVGVYLTSTRGGTERLIAAGGRQPRFSPDGRWIAFWTGPEVTGDPQAVTHSQIFVMPAAGGTPRRLAAGFSDAGHPVWSPDSAAVLFTGHRIAGDPNDSFWMAPLTGEPPSLKARWPAESNNSIAPPEPFAWPEPGVVLFHWYHPIPGATTGIWRAHLPKYPQTTAAATEPLTSGGVPYDWCSTDRTGRLVLASRTTRSAIWTLPIDAATAAVRGPMAPLVVEGERQIVLSLTSDGRQLVFAATDRRGVDRLFLRNLASGQQTVVEVGPALKAGLMTPDARWMAVTVAPGEDPRRLASEITLPDNVGLRVFPQRLAQWDISRDGTAVLGVRLSSPRSVELITIHPPGFAMVLQHPLFNLYLSTFSPDNRWILVTAENGLDPPHLFAAPFRQPYPVPYASWVDLGEGVFGRWAPDGKRIYFLRDHDGSRCLYTMVVDAVTRKPVGDAVPVMHFHSAWRSPLQLEPANFRLMVGRDKLVFTLGETQSDLWLAEP